MPDRPTSDPKQFIQGAPVLQVPDVLASIAFYRDVLGFTCDYVEETYGVVWRDNSAIHFGKSDSTPTGVNLFQWVIDVDDYYNEVKANGAEISAEIGDREYEIRDFSVIDNNGVTVVFGQDIDY